MGSLNQNCIGIEHSGELVTFNSKRIEPLKSLKVYFSPVQEGEGDPSPQNVRNILGWDGVKANHTKKNLFGGQAFESAVSPSVLHEDEHGKYIRLYNVTNVKPIFQMPFKENTQYTIIGRVRRSYETSVSGIRIIYTDGSWDGVLTGMSKANEIVTIRTISKANKTVSGLYYLQRTVNFDIFYEDFGIFEGSVATADFEPYQGTANQISWQSEHGTIYGGYVDLVTGELVATTIVRDLSDFSSIEAPNSSSAEPWNHRWFVRNWVQGVGWDGGSLGYLMSDCLVKSNGLTNGTFHPYGYIYDNTISTVAEFRAKYAGYHMAYNLKEAAFIRYQLTLQQIQTLIGTNNIWSNADSVTAETYYIEPVQQTYKKFFYNEPHIVSASGDLITFDTDMKAPLKECKIGFSPIQLGEGDPSPDNVREIQGWDGIDVTLCGRNLFNKDNFGYYSWDTGIYNNTQSYSYWRFKVNEGDVIRVNGTGGGVGCFFDKDGNNFGKIVSNITTVPQNAVEATNNLTHSGAETSIVTLNNTDTSYEEYKGTSVSINWFNEYGTIYGGYLDLVNNEVVATHYGFIADGVNIKANYGYQTKLYFGGGIVYNVPVGKKANNATASTNVICEKMPVYSSISKSFPYIYIPPAGNLYTVFYVGVNSEHSEVTTNAQRVAFTNEWLQNNPQKVVYELATPIHYPLTPQQILTLKQTNNIYSNTNGNIEVKYWKH